MFAISNDRLSKLPDIGVEVTCIHCGQSHKVKYGTVEKDGKQVESKTLGYIKCDETDSTFLVAINGKNINAKV